MINIKATVVSALTTATAIYTIVSNRVHFHYPPSFKTLPCISYFELNNAGLGYADNVEMASELLFRIDLWGNDSLSTLALAVDVAMKSKDFVRIGSIDLWESDTKIHHKSITYQNMYIDPTF